MDTSIYASSVGLNVCPGKYTFLGVPDSFVDVRVACHAGAHNLRIGVVGLELWDVNIEAVSERQKRAALGAALDNLVDDLDGHLGDEGGRVAAVLDVKVGNLWVAT